ncbi:MAG: 50S ribosomal protein L29 [Myxococcaceae bacterium]|nr:50S ribosomal protein L29 [Myxococcaceae bacterium]
MATTKELRELNADDLTRRAGEMRQTLFQDQLKLKTGALDNPSERTAHKRELARVLTVLNEKKKAAVAAKKQSAKKVNNG